MSEYTPTTEQVRQFWASDGNFHPAAKSYDYYESLLEFDRWLAAHEAAIKAEAWDEGVDAFESAHRWDNSEPWQHLVSNPYKEAPDE